MDTFVAHLNPHSSDFGDICALHAPFVHQLTMQSSLSEPKRQRPCPSYSRHRDRINLVFCHSLFKGGGGGYCFCRGGDMTCPVAGSVLKIPRVPPSSLALPLAEGQRADAAQDTDLFRGLFVTQKSAGSEDSAPVLMSFPGDAAEVCRLSGRLNCRPFLLSYPQHIGAGGWAHARSSHAGRRQWACGMWCWVRQPPAVPVAGIIGRCRNILPDRCDSARLNFLAVNTLAAAVNHSRPLCLLTVLFLHPLPERLKCCFCGSKGASMTDFHDLHLKEQQLLQQKWEECVDVNEGNVCDLCVRSVKPSNFF